MPESVKTQDKADPLKDVFGDNAPTTLAGAFLPPQPKPVVDKRVEELESSVSVLTNKQKSDDKDTRDPQTKVSDGPRAFTWIEPKQFWTKNGTGGSNTYTSYEEIDLSDACPHGARALLVEVRMVVTQTGSSNGDPEMGVTYKASNQTGENVLAEYRPYHEQVDDAAFDVTVQAWMRVSPNRKGQIKVIDSVANGLNDDWDYYLTAVAYM